MSASNKFFDRKWQLLTARCGLQACRNLEPHFMAVNDLESAAYFRARARHWQREISKLEAAQ